MRENIGLFKAKVEEFNNTLNLNEDDWIIGHYAKKKARCTSTQAPDTWHDEHFICVPVRNKTYEYFEDVPIKFETLCECTGLKDKNGKMIFENDIVRIDNGKSYKPRYSLLSVDWEINGFYYNSIIDNLYRNYDLGKSQTQDIFEVIGNKFEEAVK